MILARELVKGTDTLCSATTKATQYGIREPASDCIGKGA